jgi:hypothetical protein
VSYTEFDLNGYKHGVIDIDMVMGYKAVPLDPKALNLKSQTLISIA